MGHVVNPLLFRLNYVSFWSTSLVVKKKFSMYFEVNSFYLLKYLKNYFKKNDFIDYFFLYNINIKLIYLNNVLKIFLIFKQHRKFRLVIKKKLKKVVIKNLKYFNKRSNLKFLFLKFNKIRGKINFFKNNNRFYKLRGKNIKTKFFKKKIKKFKMFFNKKMEKFFKDKTKMKNFKINRAENKKEKVYKLRRKIKYKKFKLRKKLSFKKKFSFNLKNKTNLKLSKNFWLVNFVKKGKNKSKVVSLFKKYEIKSRNSFKQKIKKFARKIEKNYYAKRYPVWNFLYKKFFYTNKNYYYFRNTNLKKKNVFKNVFKYKKNNTKKFTEVWIPNRRYFLKKRSYRKYFLKIKKKLNLNVDMFYYKNLNARRKEKKILSFNLPKRIDIRKKLLLESRKNNFKYKKGFYSKKKSFYLKKKPNNNNNNDTDIGSIIRFFLLKNKNNIKKWEKIKEYSLPFAWKLKKLETKVKRIKRLKLKKKLVFGICKSKKSLKSKFKRLTSKKKIKKKKSYKFINISKTYYNRYYIFKLFSRRATRLNKGIFYASIKQKKIINNRRNSYYTKKFINKIRANYSIAFKIRQIFNKIFRYKVSFYKHSLKNNKFSNRYLKGRELIYFKFRKKNKKRFFIGKTSKKKYKKRKVLLLKYYKKKIISLNETNFKVFQKKIIKPKKKKFKGLKKKFKGSKKKKLKKKFKFFNYKFKETNKLEKAPVVFINSPNIPFSKKNTYKMLKKKTENQKKNKYKMLKKKIENQKKKNFKVFQKKIIKPKKEKFKILKQIKFKKLKQIKFKSLKSMLNKKKYRKIAARFLFNFKKFFKYKSNAKYKIKLPNKTKKLNFKINKIIKSYSNKNTFKIKLLAKKNLLKKNLKFRNNLKKILKFSKISHKKTRRIKKLLKIKKKKKFVALLRRKRRIIKKRYRRKFQIKKYNKIKSLKIKKKKFKNRSLRWLITNFGSLNFKLNFKKKIKYSKNFKKNWIKKFKKVSKKNRFRNLKMKSKLFKNKKYNKMLKQLKKGLSVRKKNKKRFKKNRVVTKYGKNKKLSIINFKLNESISKKIDFKSYTNKYFLFLYYLKILNFKYKFLFCFNILFNYKININILIFIKKFWGTLVSADIIADWIILRLLQKNRIEAIMRSILRYLKKKIRRKKLYGYALLIMGRFSRKDRATYSWYKKGPFTRSNRLIFIDYANRQVALRFSKCSFKINLIKSLGFKNKL